MVSELGSGDCCGGNACCEERTTGPVKAEHIRIEDLAAIEEAVGVGRAGWDMVDPRELVAAAVNALAMRALGGARIEEYSDAIGQLEKVVEEKKPALPSGFKEILDDDHYWVFVADETDESFRQLLIVDKCVKAATRGQLPVGKGIHKSSDMPFAVRYLAVRNGHFDTKLAREAIELATGYEQSGVVGRFQAFAESEANADVIERCIEQLRDQPLDKQRRYEPYHG